MESYEVLEQAIPKSASSKVAQLLGVTADYVRRWRREPDSDGNPSGSGQRSILDRICDLIDVVFLVNPKGTSLIVNHINSHHRNLLDTHATPLDTQMSRAETISDLLTKTTEAVNRLNLDGCTNEALCGLVELRDSADRAIQSVEKTLGGNSN
jgi:hypothetical protein